MKNILYNLIVIAPGSAGLKKVQISRQAVLLLVAAFLLSFCSTVLLLHDFPLRAVNESDRQRLRAENQELKVDIRNAQFGERKLKDHVSSVEEKSKEIIELVQSD